MKKLIILLCILVFAACSKDDSPTPLENGDFKIVITKEDAINQTSVLASFMSDTNAKIVINGEIKDSFTEAVQLDQVAGTTATGETNIETRTMTLGLNVRASGDFETAQLNVKFYFNEELKHERTITFENDESVTDYLYSLDVQKNLELVESKTVL